MSHGGSNMTQTCEGGRQWCESKHECLRSEESCPQKGRCLAGIAVTNRDAQYAVQVVHGAVESARRAGLILDILVAHRTSDALVRRMYSEAVATLRERHSMLDEIVTDEYTEFGGQDSIGENLQARLSHIRNQLLDAAQQRGYECFLSLDADVVLKPDTFTKMLELDQDVVTAIYSPRWLRPDADSVVLALRDTRDFPQFAHELNAMLAADKDSRLERLCGHLDGVINFHKITSSSAAQMSIVVSGGCTVVRRGALSVRTVYGKIHCAAQLGTGQQHCFHYRGEDVGWGFNLIRAGYIPYVLTEHMPVHINAHAAPTDLMPLPSVWPINLTGKVMSLPLQACS